MTIADLRIVRNAIWDARTKWKLLGIELRLPASDLDSIEEAHRDIGRKFTEMLALWLRLDPPRTWSALVAALRLSTLGYETLAECVEREVTNSVPATKVQVGEVIG